MKRANGTGCVVKLNGNRRNPWFARAPIEYDKETGKALPPKILSDDKGRKYFPDRDIPDLLLAKYNIQKGNIDIDKSEYTFRQVYEEYNEKYFPTKEEMELEKKEHIKAKGKLGRSSALILKTAYNKCEKLYDKLYKSLKKDDFLEIILNTNGGSSTISGLIDLFKKLDIYAEESDIIVKGYAHNLKLSSNLYTNKKKKNIPYTYKEIQKIWKCKGKLVADIILMTLYTGMRIEEIFFIKNKNIHLKEKYLTGGIKTEASKNRIIPIHSEIIPIIANYYNSSNEFLLVDKKRK